LPSLLRKKIIYYIFNIFRKDLTVTFDVEQFKANMEADLWYKTASLILTHIEEKLDDLNILENGRLPHFIQMEDNKIVIMHYL
jgi:hypothetical protein